MNIAFFANPGSVHDCKWINILSKKHKCYVICNVSNDQSLWQLENKIEVFPILPDTYSAISNHATKSILLDFVKEKKIDICHSMYLYTNALWVTLIDFDFHIITTRGSDILIDLEKTLKTGNNIRERVAHFVLRRACLSAIKKAYFITSTSFAQYKVISKYVRQKDRLHKIPTGINWASIEAFLGEQNTNPLENDYIFSARSMAPIYRIELIVDTFYAFIQKDNGEMKLVLIDDKGQTAYSKKIREQIKKLGIEERIYWVNSITLAQMTAFYKHAQACLMLPKSDGTPNTALEAMYCKTPLIMSNLPYDDDLFDKQFVYRANSDDPIEIAQLIVKAIQDPQKEQKLTKARANVIQKASLMDSIEKIESLYLG
jgi:glycosyltransferase involved in cell wall biosynthesis